MGDINGDFLQWFINCLRKTSGSSIKNENISNKELVEELQKPIIRKLKKRKVQSFLIDYTWGTDLANMQLISRFNKGIDFFIMLFIFSVKRVGY